MRLLSQIKRPIAREFELFQTRFEEVLHASDNALLTEVLSYLHLQRGKQMRPMLTLLSANLCGHITPKTIDTAVALEMLHTASLLHDDVVDGADTRRGLLSVNARWNNKVAILTGDYLLSQVILLTAEIHNSRILNVIAKLGSDLAQGELLELNPGQDMWINEQQYIEIIRYKTAKLFAACTEAGALSSGSTARQCSTLRQYGTLLGICFQLQDDILDYSDSERLGKPTMGDISDGKVTLPLIVALQRAPKKEAQELKQLVTITIEQRTSNTATEQAVRDMESEVKSFVLRYGGIRSAQQTMKSYANKAIEALDYFHTNSSTKDALIDMVTYTTTRNS